MKTRGPLKYHLQIVVNSLNNEYRHSTIMQQILPSANPPSKPHHFQKPNAIQNTRPQLPKNGTLITSSLQPQTSHQKPTEHILSLFITQLNSHNGLTNHPAPPPPAQQVTPPQNFSKIPQSPHNLTKTPSPPTFQPQPPTQAPPAAPATRA